MAESTGVIAVGGGYAGVMAVDRLTRNDEVGGEAEPRPHRCPPAGGPTGAARLRPVRIRSRAPGTQAGTLGRIPVHHV